MQNHFVINVQSGATQTLNHFVINVLSGATTQTRHSNAGSSARALGLGAEPKGPRWSAEYICARLHVDNKMVLHRGLGCWRPVTLIRY